MKCEGLHCGGCGHGGSGLGILAGIVAVGFVAYEVTRKPVEHAIGEAVHVAEMVMLVAGCVLAAGIAGILLLTTYRLARWVTNYVRVIRSRRTVTDARSDGPAVAPGPTLPADLPAPRVVGWPVKPILSQDDTERLRRSSPLN